MRTSFYFRCLAFLLLVSAMSCHHETSEHRAIASIFLQPKSMSANAVPLFTTVSFSTNLKNNSSKRISITHIESPCNCVHVGVDKNELDPGESAHLSGELRGAGQPGIVGKEVTITFDHDVKLKFPISVKFIRTINWVPESLVLSPSLFDRRPSLATLVLHNDSDQTVKIKSVSTEHVVVRRSFAGATLEPGANIAMEFEASATSLAAQSGSVSITTDHERERTVIVPVQVVPIEILHCFPAEVRLGAVSKTELLNRPPILIVLKGDVLTSLEFAGVESPRFMNVVPASGEKEPGRISFHVEFRNNFDGLDLRGSIKFKFLHAGQPVSLETPVSGILVSR
jgi:hypothetical protein